MQPVFNAVATEFNAIGTTHSMFKSKKKNDIFQLYAIIFCLMLKFMLNW